MLYVSLVLSTILLFLVNWAARRASRPIWQIAVCGLGVGMLFPTLGLQSLLLLVVTVIWMVMGRGPKLFLPLSCLATLGAYSVGTYIALASQWEYARLRDRFPYVSMDQRLGSSRGAVASDQLPESTAESLDRLEDAIGDGGSFWRTFQLQLLHEQRVRYFVNSPGFGVTRMITPTESRLLSRVRQGPPIAQPGSRLPLEWSLGDLPPEMPVENQTVVQKMHEGSLVDFVYADGFGLFKDRQRVAGFEPHQFSQVPAPAERWAVKSVDLVGLLLHDEPVAYVSEHLPRMDKLRAAPTRPLDIFESAGLEKLKSGEDLFVRVTGDRMRLLGAIRSVKICLNCHNGERGDLLGAFTYTLQREDLKKEDESSQ